LINVHKKKTELRGGGTLNRLGFLIMSVLHVKKATSRLSAMTIREIAEAEELGYKGNTVFKKIKEMEGRGYIGRGLKEGHADTFYITNEGSKFLAMEKEMAGSGMQEEGNDNEG
jgi:DNA-binding MarR family transcriptional regulator